MQINHNSLLSLIVLSCCCLLATCGNRTVLIGPGFWNIRSSFFIGGNDVGTHMSLIQLKSGKFVILDTVELDVELQGEIDNLTKNGTLMEAVLATHSYHTTYFPAFYKIYPHVPFYGTPRHLKIQPDIPWAGSMYDCDVRQKWLPEVHCRIPKGAEFATAASHFSGIHVFHPGSRTIHIDDTIILDKDGTHMRFESSMEGGLFHIPESPTAYSDWVKKYINDWDFVNLCAAHNGVNLNTAKQQLQQVMANSVTVFNNLVQEFTKNPSASDETAFQAMQAHEAKCEE